MTANCFFWAVMTCSGISAHHTTLNILHTTELCTLMVHFIACELSLKKLAPTVWGFLENIKSCIFIYWFKNGWREEGQIKWQEDAVSQVWK